ncbi:hypothetical protein HK099_008716 [Clydaea vesicula]|uniref:Uncharacterized protein n=1 Tax=Clydaea vesicula TaxID=447962 RepID=A0AAD5TX53_9FUNG|nr:hypothetical protein HK099_008716 [Clydaea vesicula]
MNFSLASIAFFFLNFVAGCDSIGNYCGDVRVSEEKSHIFQSVWGDVEDKFNSDDVMQVINRRCEGRGCIGTVPLFESTIELKAIAGTTALLYALRNMTFEVLQHDFACWNEVYSRDFETPNGTVTRTYTKKFVRVPYSINIKGYREGKGSGFFIVNFNEMVPENKYSACAWVAFGLSLGTAEGVPVLADFSCMNLGQRVLGENVQTTTRVQISENQFNITQVIDVDGRMVEESYIETLIKTYN